MNKEYEELIAYLEEIMHKLQDQSDYLRGKDIAICVSNNPKKLDIGYGTDNACFIAKSAAILFDLEYLRKCAAWGEDGVASTIAHELSHYVYKEKNQLRGGKEEEIFADNYGLILCHRAGYNVRVNVDRRKRELSSELNIDEHPQDKIRQLVMLRTCALFGFSEAPSTSFKVNIPHKVDKNEINEYCNNLLKMRNQSIKAKTVSYIETDLEWLKDNENQNKNQPALVAHLLSLHSFKHYEKNTLLTLNFSNCCMEDLSALYEKVEKSPEIFNNEVLLKKFRKAFIRQKMIFEEDGKTRERIAKLDKFFVGRMGALITAREKINFAVEFMQPVTCFQNKEDRKKVYCLYAEGLRSRYGKDDGSWEYAEKISAELQLLKGKISNTEVIGLVKELQKSLDIKGTSLPVLQDFALKNSFEVQQIRTEILISECLVNQAQALKTLKFLTDDSQKPFQFQGVYDKSGKILDSYIDKQRIEDIREDWKDISPEKRAQYFSLLMESIDKPCEEKLALFVDGKRENDDVFKFVVDSYIQAYLPEQRPYIVATLVSYKDTDKPFSYEDYFKKILLNSGVQGRAIYNKLYQEGVSEEILDAHRNYSPVYADNGIIFSNLAKLGDVCKKNSDLRLKRLGETISSVTDGKYATLRHISQGNPR